MGTTGSSPGLFAVISGIFWIISGFSFIYTRIYLENIVYLYHFIRQLCVVLGVKLIEIWNYMIIATCFPGINFRIISNYSI